MMNRYQIFNANNQLMHCVGTAQAVGDFVVTLPDLEGVWSFDTRAGTVDPRTTWACSESINGIVGTPHKLCGLYRELSVRATNGLNPLTIKGIEARLNAIGFTLDRSKDCPHVSRWMTG